MGTTTGFLNAGSLLDRAAVGVSVQQLVTDFGRTRHLVDSGRLHEQSMMQTETATRASVLLDVDRAYFRALRGQALLRVAQETVAARQLSVDQVTALAQSNLKSQLDVSFASVNLADARLLAATAQDEVGQAFADLSNSLGFPEPRAFDLAEAAVAMTPEPDVSALIRQALQQRPDLAGLRLDRDSALQLTEAERALSRPTLSAAGVAGGVPAHDDHMTGRYGAVGINISSAQRIAVRGAVIPNRKKKALQAEVRKHVEAGSALYSDALQSYNGLDEFEHQVGITPSSTSMEWFTRTDWKISGASSSVGSTEPMSASNRSIFSDTSMSNPIASIIAS